MKTNAKHFSLKAVAASIDSFKSENNGQERIY